MSVIRSFSQLLYLIAGGWQLRESPIAWNSGPCQSMTINQYSTNIKSLCHKILKLASFKSKSISKVLQVWIHTKSIPRLNTTNFLQEEKRNPVLKKKKKRFFTTVLLKKRRLRSCQILTDSKNCNPRGTRSEESNPTKSCNSWTSVQVLAPVQVQQYLFPWEVMNFLKQLILHWQQEPSCWWSGKFLSGQWGKLIQH